MPRVAASDDRLSPCGGAGKIRRKLEDSGAAEMVGPIRAIRATVIRRKHVNHPGDCIHNRPSHILLCAGIQLARLQLLHL